MAVTWNDLPELPLVKIFRCLSIIDRKNASLTCKSWSRILHFPSLWNSVYCIFKPEYNFKSYDNPFAVRLTKCLPLVRHCAPWIRELTIVSEEGADNDEDMFEVLETMQTFLESLLEEDIQLRKFRMKLASDPSYEGQIIQNLLLTLAKFLRRQNSLISFCANWSLPPIYCVFLSTLAFNSANTLKLLEIKHHESKWFQEIYSFSLSTLKELRYLTLPLDVLGEETMEVLVNNCQFLTLLTLRIRLHGNDQLGMYNLVSEETWKKVSEKLPKLRVAIEIGNFGKFAINPKILDSLLPSTIPIIGVKTISWDPLKPKILSYFYKFKDQIRSLDIVCGKFKFRAIDLINSCPNLSMLKLITNLSRGSVNSLTDLNITDFRDLKRFILVLELSEELQHREQEIINRYRSLWNSDQYCMEIFCNPNVDFEIYLRKKNFYNQLYP